MSDLQDFPDLEHVVRAALAARVENVSPTVDTAELTERVGRADRRRRYRALAVAVLIVLVAIGVPVALTRGGGNSGAPPVTPATPTPSAAPTSSATPTPLASRTSPTIRTAPKISIVGHPYFAARSTTDHLVLIDPITGDQVRSINVMQEPANDTQLLADSVATFPTGGWLVAASSGTCRTNLYRVFADGRQQRLLAAAQIPQIAELAVAPDGRHAAAVATNCTRAGERLLVFDLASADAHSWELGPSAEATSFTGLSWAPDSRHLAYLAGLSTGAGMGGGYAIVDALDQSASLTEPPRGTAHVTIANRSCDVQRGFYLGTTGRFAVVATCSGEFDLEIATVPVLEADPTGTLLARLLGANGTRDIQSAVTSDGQNVLVTTDNVTYRITDGATVNIGGPWRSPSW